MGRSSVYKFISSGRKPTGGFGNLKFIAGSLKPKNNEVPIDTIRRYLSAGFFKNHLKTYKKRSIYWPFSSGKQRAFECLVYLHRYNKATLPRMRSNYVTPLQGKFNARLDYLRTERDALDTASAKKKIQKEIDILKKKTGGTFSIWYWFAPLCWYEDITWSGRWCESKLWQVRESVSWKKGRNW